MRFIVISLLFLSFVTLGCDIDGYHSLGYFPSRLSAEQEVLKLILSKYDEIDKGYYKVAYQFPEAGKELKYAIWYGKDVHELGIENDIYSGMICTWKNVDESVLKVLVSEKKGIQKARISKSLIHPDWGNCPY
ncbi:hypothetical protein WBJ53_04820 [Spirosoma sp. SC4-14]|uniref:hypothetical protein n=1 Tax=Spirosoma sp. SC4-14 TaxID=3128900 RepID=UPI0030D26D04